MNEAALNRGRPFRTRLVEASQRVKRDGRHRYWLTDPGGGDRIELYGVTSVIGTLDKSGPLMKWAANVQFASDIDAAYSIYVNPLKAGLDADKFATQFKKIQKANVGEKERDEAAEMGTLVHELVEIWLLDQLNNSSSFDKRLRDFPELAVEVFRKKFLPWAYDVGLVPYATECMVYHEELGYGGQVDFLGEIEGRVKVADWKTAKALRTSNLIQIAAYRRALVRMGVTEEMLDGVNVRLPKDPKDEVETLVSNPGDALLADEKLLGVFDSLIEVYPWKRAEDNRSKREWYRRKKAS